eukprot:4739114-Pyramimonas_sp.AAC.1
MSPIYFTVLYCTERCTVLGAQRRGVRLEQVEGAARSQQERVDPCRCAWPSHADPNTSSPVRYHFTDREWEAPIWCLRSRNRRGDDRRI